MQWSDISFSPRPRALRQFAVSWIVFFTVLAAWHGAWRGRTELGLTLLALALAIGPLGLIRPRAIRPIYVGWMVLAFPIGWLVSSILLAIVYYGIFTPIALVFRLLGRDALGRRTRKTDTYWQPKRPVTDVRGYFRQF
ncbi:MAG TPA: SxtJ family membrane protein [Pirellulales bacterium]|nr:SxtJ family membrane protein [Pirellulales bacterium]